MTSIIYGIADVLRDFYQETYVYNNLHAPITDLSGKVIIVTGATAGLGKESVRQLALMKPAKIIMTARNMAKGERVRTELISQTGYKNIQLESLDLCSMQSVNALSAKLSKERIHVLMCNAGVGETKDVAKKTADGFDEMFQGNNLGHYLLTQNLMASLHGTASDPARVIFLSSLASKMTFSFSLDSYANPQKLSGRDYYMTSKLMAVLMASGLAERHKNVIFSSVHPGTVKTEFADKYEGFMTNIFPIVYRLFERPLEQGAATQVYVASTKDHLESGRYWSNCKVWKMNPVAEDPKLCREFCELCDELIRPFQRG